jgi:hypothetical protein
VWFLFTVISTVQYSIKQHKHKVMSDLMLSQRWIWILLFSAMWGRSFVDNYQCFAVICCLRLQSLKVSRGIFAGTFYHEDCSGRFLWNVGTHQPSNMKTQARNL